mmetsp:Transcript_103617/g.290206  ORF Transcript_103617/g.290206 Transcript_103617/m.290206 type:complete len:262 (-) Transcript_103617:88-873(-)
MTDALASSFSSSATPRTAQTDPLIPTKIAVFPSLSKFCSCCSTSLEMGIFSRSAKVRLPAATVIFPRIVPDAPRPVIATKFDGWAKLLISLRCSSEYATTAAANGCSELRSSEPTSHKSAWSTSIPIASAVSRSASSGMIVVQSVTTGLPRVRVPVLSKMRAFTLPAISRVSPPFIKTPWRAPTPVPTITAVGVASPRAQGQLMTKHAMPNRRLKVAGLSSWYQAAGTIPPLQQPYHTRKVRKEMVTTDGTKMLEIVSASF